MTTLEETKKEKKETAKIILKYIEDTWMDMIDRGRENDHPIDDVRNILYTLEHSEDAFAEREEIKRRNGGNNGRGI